MNELISVSGSLKRAAASTEQFGLAVGLPITAPLDWLRQRRVDRDARRVDREVRKAELAHQRLAQRLDVLGDGWRVLDLKPILRVDQVGWLAVGPGGIFAVTVKDHGRSKISFAGDVVQIDGRRPRYVAEARSNAQLAADALSRSAGVRIPVMPVLAFAGSGSIVFHGLPKGCIVTAYQDLHRVLHSRGNRISTETAYKVYAVASNPQTWMSEEYAQLADGYRWYPDGSRTDADKPATHR